jgi:hypothetical protein
MKTYIRALLIVMSVLILSGCGGKAEIAAPQPLGTLVAIEYNRRVEMVRDENFFIRVNPRQIESLEYFLEEDNDYRLKTGITLENGQWQQLETTALELLPNLTEIKSQQTLRERLLQKVLPSPKDGADSSTLSFDWETADGIVSVSYNWKYDDPKMQEFISLLKSLEQNAKGE